jgi:hypothetical protein
MNPTSLATQLAFAFWAVWLTCYLIASVRERRRKLREDEAWVDNLIARYHEDLRKRYRNGRWAPKDRYGKFTINDNK